MVVFALLEDNDDREGGGRDILFRKVCFFLSFNIDLLKYASLEKMTCAWAHMLRTCKHLSPSYQGVAGF